MGLFGHHDNNDNQAAGQDQTQAVPPAPAATPDAGVDTSQPMGTADMGGMQPPADTGAPMAPGVGTPPVGAPMPPAASGGDAMGTSDPMGVTPDVSATPPAEDGATPAGMPSTPAPEDPAGSEADVPPKSW